MSLYTAIEEEFVGRATCGCGARDEPCKHDCLMAHVQERKEEIIQSWEISKMWSFTFDRFRQNEWLNRNNSFQQESTILFTKYRKYAFPVRLL